MTLPAPTYDLVLLLDPQAEESVRAKLVADARAAIEAQGEFLRHDEWGTRTLTYPIDRNAVAEYHLLQFHAGAPELLSALDRTLRIADGILRFRLVKLKPGVPDPPDMRAAATVTQATEREPHPRVAVEPEAGVALEAQAAVEPEAEAEGAVEAQAAVEPEAEVAAETTVGEPA